MDMTDVAATIVAAAEAIGSQFEDEDSGGAGSGGSQQVRQEQLCQICGDTSDSQHFGASSCRACAAFFRRTVSRRLRYACRFEDNCDFSKTCRAMCKSCRLAKCLQVGMDPNAVRSRPHFELPNGGQSKRKPKSEENAFQQHSINFVCPITAPSSTAPPLAASQSASLLGTGRGMGHTEDDHHNHQVGGDPISMLELTSISPSSSAGTQSTANADSTMSNEKKSMVLEEIVRLKEGIQLVEEGEGGGHQLPSEYAALAKILLGYNRLERQRDIRYNRLRQSNGTKIRMFVEKQTLDLFTYWQNLRNEIEWVAEMLLHLGPYQQIPLEDKLTLLRNFWILFIILERNYDTFNVLKVSEDGEDDPRMVFASGEIFDMDKCEYDGSRAEHPEVRTQLKISHEIECPLKPWFKRSVREVMPLVRQLRPQPMEIAFCFGLLFWRFPADVGQKLSSGTLELAQGMVDCLYRELAQFYANQMPGENPVRRVAQLCHLISITEILALQRKEEMILARTFKAFKVDIYMEEVFGYV